MERKNPSSKRNALSKTISSVGSKWTKFKKWATKRTKPESVFTNSHKKRPRFEWPENEYGEPGQRSLTGTSYEQSLTDTQDSTSGERTDQCSERHIFQSRFSYRTSFESTHDPVKREEMNECSSQQTTEVSTEEGSPPESNVQEVKSGNAGDVIEEPIMKKLKELEIEQVDTLDKLAKCEKQVERLESELQQEIKMLQIAANEHQAVSASIKLAMKLIASMTEDHERMLQTGSKIFDTSAENKARVECELQMKHIKHDIDERNLLRRYMAQTSPDDGNSSIFSRKLKIKAAYWEMKRLSRQPEDSPSVGPMSKPNADIIRKTMFSTTYRLNSIPKGQDNIDLCATVMEFCAMDQSCEKHLREEGMAILRFLSFLSFPHLPTIYALNLTEQRLTITQELLSVSLSSYVIRNGPMGRDEAKLRAVSLAKAIDFLHSNGITHQNISPTSVYLDREENLKLSALEWSSLYYDTENDRISKRTAPPPRTCQHGAFVAPEVLAGSEYDPVKADVYSFAIVLYFMVTGKYQRLTSLGKKLQNEISNASSADCARLILSAAHENPDARLDVRHCLSHPWLSF